jgi:dihydrofolate reductase
VLSRGRASPYEFDFHTRDDTGQPLKLPFYDEVVQARRAGHEPPQEYIPFARVHSLDQALELAAGDPEPFVIGGGQIFELALPRAERLYVTWVEADVSGDTYFPPLNLDDWQLIHSEPAPADAKNDYDTTYCMYDRKAEHCRR